MSDTTDPLRIARFLFDQTQQNALVQRLGFPSAGEIERFLMQSYGKAVREIVPADRLKGHIFVLEPAVLQGEIAKPNDLIPVIRQIKQLEQDSILSLPLDIGNPPESIASPKMPDLNSKVGGAWLKTHAEQLSSSLDACVVHANGVTASVFVSGRLYLDLGDVIEGFDRGPNEDFQKLSWANGEILFHFAEQDLNNRTPLGIWKLPDDYILKPNPETLIGERLRQFLQYRMQGLLNLERESHVENEGRLDVALYLLNGFIYLIEIKWMGKSLKKTHQGRTNEEILEALKQKKNWFTDFGDTIIDSGLKQVVIYCATGKFRRGYLSVFDCQKLSKTETNRTIQKSETNGQDPANFRVIRAAVDPRSASVKSKV